MRCLNVRSTTGASIHGLSCPAMAGFTRKIITNFAFYATVISLRLTVLMCHIVPV